MRSHLLAARHRWGQPPDDLAAGLSSAAAWGDPPVIARCGLPAPAPTADSCVDVDGVDWVVRPLTDGSAAVTYGREPALEVLVPAEHGPVPLLLPAFGGAARALPETATGTAPGRPPEVSAGRSVARARGKDESSSMRSL